MPVILRYFWYYFTPYFIKCLVILKTFLIWRISQYNSHWRTRWSMTYLSIKYCFHLIEAAPAALLNPDKKDRSHSACPYFFAKIWIAYYIGYWIPNLCCDICRTNTSISCFNYNFPWFFGRMNCNIKGRTIITKGVLNRFADFLSCFIYVSLSGWSVNTLSLISLKHDSWE